MVGGWIISIEKMEECFKLWVCDGRDELCVHVMYDHKIGLPEVGEEIWWQGGRVFFRNNRLSIRKLGNSHDPWSCRGKVANIV